MTTEQGLELALHIHDDDGVELVAARDAANAADAVVEVDDAAGQRHEHRAAQLRHALGRERAHLHDVKMARARVLGVARIHVVAGNEDGLRLGEPRARFDAADKGIAKDHDGAASRATRHAVGLANHEAVDAILLGLHRAGKDAADTGDETAVKFRQSGRSHETRDEIGLFHQSGHGGQHLQIIGGALVRQQEDDEVDLFAVHRAVMHNAIATAADRKHVAARHFHPHVRQGHAVAKVGGHRALALHQTA